jgi:hypothetical protein
MNNNKRPRKREKHDLKIKKDKEGKEQGELQI